MESFQEWSTGVVEGVVLISQHVILPAMFQYQITTDNLGQIGRPYSAGYHGNILRDIVFLARPKGGSGQTKCSPKLKRFGTPLLPPLLDVEHWAPRQFLGIILERFHPLLRPSPENAEEQLSGPPISSQSLRLFQTEIEDLAARAVDIILQETLGSIVVEAGKLVKILYTKVQQEIRRQLVSSSPASWISEKSNVLEVAAVEKSVPGEVERCISEVVAEHLFPQSPVSSPSKGTDTSSNASTKTCLDTTLEEVVSMLLEKNIGLSAEAMMELVTNISCLFQERSPNQVEMSEDNLVSMLTTACKIICLVLDNRNAAHEVLGHKSARRFVKSGDENLSFFVRCLSKSLVHNAASELKEMRQKTELPQTLMTYQAARFKEDKTKTRSQGEKSDGVAFDIDLKQTADRMFAAIMNESSDSDDGSRSTSFPLTALRQLPAELICEVVQLLLNTPTVRDSSAQSHDLDFRNNTRLSKESLSDLLYLFIRTAFRNFLINSDGDDDRERVATIEATAEVLSSRARDILKKTCNDPEIALAIISKGTIADTSKPSPQVNTEEKEPARNPSPLSDMGEYFDELTSTDEEESTSPDILQRAVQNIFISELQLKTIIFHIIQILSFVEAPKSMFANTNRCLCAYLFLGVERLLRDKAGISVSHEDNAHFSKRISMAIIDDAMGRLSLDVLQNRVWLRDARYGSQGSILPLAEILAAVISSHYGVIILTDSGHGGGCLDRRQSPNLEENDEVVSNCSESSTDTWNSDSVSSRSEEQLEGPLPMTGADLLNHPKCQRTKGLESEDPNVSGTKEKKRRKLFLHFIRAAFCCTLDSACETLPSTVSKEREGQTLINTIEATTSDTEKKTLFCRVRGSFTKAFSFRWIKRRSPKVAPSC